MVPQSEIKAEPSTVERHLRHITRRWRELDEPCLLEMVFLSAEDRAQVKQVMHYTADDNGIDLAVSDALSWSKMGVNVYATVNPVSETNRPSAHKRASAQHIVGSFFHWADADDAQAAENIRQFVGPKCTFHVLTGTEPSYRPHVYWELEEPTRNLQSWERTQKNIAATLKTDSSVTDPPRIMRVAGTINWPKPQKLAKGYKAELVTLKIYDEDERPAVTSDQMARVFKDAAPAPSTGLTIDTGELPKLDRERTAIQAMTGEEWNTSVFKLVGSYVRKGLSDGEIVALCEPLTTAGYTVDDTRAEVQVMIDRTRANPAFEPEPSPVREMTESEKDAVPAAIFTPWVEKDLTRIPYPQFVYSDFYARGYTSVTLAPPKVGKSMLGLAEAVDMATGRGFLTGVPQEPVKVVYYNAEDDQDVIDSRVSALLTHYGIDQSEIVGRLFATSGVERDDFVMIGGQEGIINEPLFVSIEKFIHQTGAAALVFDPLQDLSHSPETNEVFRLLGQRLRRMASSTSVALGLIHHTRKIAPGMTATIDDGRGGSALRGTSRFNRLLIGMSEDEAAKAGIDNHRHYMRIADMESNLAPPSADVNRWFEKVSVPTPNGRSVGAIKPWKWPDAFDGVSKHDAARVRAEIDAMAEPPRADVRSGSWVGNIVASVLGLNITKSSDKAKVKSIAAKWIETDVLRIVEGRDPRAGRSVNVVVCGANNPISEPSS